MKTDSILDLLPSYLDLSTVAKWREGDTFHFKMKLINTDSKAEMTFDYSGGYLAFLPDTLLGKRVRDAIQGRKTRCYYPDNIRYAEPLELAFTLSKPTLPGVLYSLLMDSHAGVESFPDFCSNLGYDEDSRKAFATWEACRVNGDAFRRIVGKDFGTLETVFQDY